MVFTKSSGLNWFRTSSASTHHAQRWSEEMVLVIEEMCQVIQYLDWKVLWWHSQGTVRSPTTQPDIVSRLNTYTECQADLRGVVVLISMIVK